MQENKKGCSRRQFLKWSLGAGAAIALSSALPPILSRVKASDTAQTPASPTTDLRSWCMVIDLKKCDGCTSLDVPPQCTQSCTAGHYVPKGQQWIQVYRIDLPNGGSYFMPTPCQQCENAPCCNVCPVGATYHDPSGVVLIDHNRCIGCRFCMAACPYQRRFFNWSTPELPPEAALVKYSPIYPVPAKKGTVIKCMFCAHRLMNGELPHCVIGCPNKALYMGDLNADIGTNGAEVVQLNKFMHENDAYRYKEGLGTQPRVWYLPGHGQAVGRSAEDTRQLKDPEWSYGGHGYAGHPGVFPWGKELK